jgi:glycosyltransferase involved in cell wall biosynthesis
VKVLQVLPALDGGGVERGTLEIAAALAAAGHESVVLSAGGRLVRILERQGSRHQAWDIGRKSPRSLLQVRSLRRWLQAERFDIIHLRSRMPAWITWLAWRGMDPATRPHLVTTVHGLHSVSRYSAIVTRGERVIAVSRAVRDYILENYPATDPGRIRLVYRGIDPAAFPRGYRAPEDWLAAWYRNYPQLIDTAVVTLPGRLTRLKGHHDFLALIRRLRDRDLPVKGLVVGGEDPRRAGYAAEIYRETARLGLGEDVIFTGHRNDVREIYAVSDVVLSLSGKPESFGRTVLEPLSMGIPVVGYAHGGVGEILDALFPEGAVQPGDDEQLARQVIAALEKSLPPVRPNTQFLLQTMQADTLAVYQELLSSERA